MMKIRILLLAALTAVFYVLLNQISLNFLPNTATPQNFILLKEKESNLLKMIENKEKKLIYLEFRWISNDTNELEVLSQPAIIDQVKSELDGFENITLNDSCMNISTCLSVFISYENENELSGVKEDISNQIQTTFIIYGSNFTVQIMETRINHINTSDYSGILNFIGSLQNPISKRIIEPLPLLPIETRNKLKDKYQDISLNIIDLDGRTYYTFIDNVKQKNNITALKKDLVNHYNLWGEWNFLNKTRVNLNQSYLSLFCSFSV